MWNIIMVPFGKIMQVCYELFNSYGIALFLYAIITRIILFPLSMKQQKGQLAMLRLRPYQEMLMKKYGNNKQKYQEELMNLYQREGYSPMSSCLPTFIQLPVIMLIYTIVRRPLTYIAGMSLKEMWPAMQPYIAKFPDLFKGATTENFTKYELQLFSCLSEEGLIEINSKFLGVFDLTKIPWDAIREGSYWLILIPIIAGLTSYLTSYISQKLNPNMSGDPQTAGSMKMMNIAMPLISVFISFTYASGLGLYWIASNIVAIGQTFLLHKIYDPKKVLAEVEEKIAREKEADKEKRRQAAERRALGNNKNSKKKRAMNAQYTEVKDDGVIDTEKEN